MPGIGYGSTENYSAYVIVIVIMRIWLAAPVLPLALVTVVVVASIEPMLMSLPLNVTAPADAVTCSAALQSVPLYVSQLITMLAIFLLEFTVIEFLGYMRTFVPAV